MEDEKSLRFHETDYSNRTKVVGRIEKTDVWLFDTGAPYQGMCKNPLVSRDILGVAAMP
ncbi:MAG: hypothetical protein ACOX7U_03175 [Desulfitobacteriia bacterium]|jgi:hypothetical protein